MLPGVSYVGGRAYLIVAGQIGAWSAALLGVGRPGDLSAGADGSGLLISPVARSCCGAGGGLPVL
ncbi:MAG: hypothetical protein VKI63_01420 [Cyanobium sp.]|nr:hypothetical protein [Cyanobium sp.]